MRYAQPIAEFGRGLGIEVLALNHGGIAQILLDEGRSLTLEEADEALLVYLTAAAPFIDTPRLVAALDSANARRADPPALQLGLRGNGNEAAVIALARVEGRSVSARDIAHAADALLAWHARWAET